MLTIPIYPTYPNDLPFPVNIVNDAACEDLIVEDPAQLFFLPRWWRWTRPCPVSTNIVVIQGYEGKEAHRRDLLLSRPFAPAAGTARKRSSQSWRALAGTKPT